MFKGDKTPVFWVGLITLCLSSVVLFSVIWSLRHPMYFSQGIIDTIPFIVGGIVFILLGLYMMKSGVNKSQID